MLTSAWDIAIFYFGLIRIYDSIFWHMFSLHSNRINSYLTKHKGFLWEVAHHGHCREGDRRCLSEWYPTPCTQAIWRQPFQRWRPPRTLGRAWELQHRLKYQRNWRHRWLRGPWPARRRRWSLWRLSILPSNLQHNSETFWMKGVSVDVMI